MSTRPRPPAAIRLHLRGAAPPLRPQPGRYGDFPGAGAAEGRAHPGRRVRSWEVSSEEGKEFQKSFYLITPFPFQDGYNHPEGF